MVVRADQRKRLIVPHPTEIVHELLTPDLRGSLEVLRTTVPVGWSNADQPFRHPGEECVHVLSGRLEVTVGNARPSSSAKAIRSPTTRPTLHWYTNRSPTSRPSSSER